MSKPGVLGRKLLLAILLCSSLVTLLMTGFILWRDYEREISNSLQAVEHIRLTYLESVAISLWNMDETQLEAQVDGMVNLPYVVQAQVIDNFGAVISGGQRQSSQSLDSYEFELIFRDKRGPRTLGVLELKIDRDLILEEVYSKAVTILISQMIRTLLISAMILLLVNHMVTRHLNSLASWADNDDLNKKPTLERRHSSEDELTRLVRAIDRQRKRVLKSLSQRDAANRKLQDLNETLEQKVAERTERLTQAFEQLQQSLEDLRETQQQLVTSEKMAQLGSLIAGVAHELNTPLGTALTAHSFVKEQLQQGSKAEMEEGLELLEQSLQRAINIVNTFKSLGVQQKHEARRRFSLTELEELLEEWVAEYGVADRISLHIELGDVWLNTYYASFVTVIRALLANSIEHGYPQGGPIGIHLTAKGTQNNWLMLEYSDDGIGMSDEIRQHAFDPFYTTRRSKGSTGLGLHLVFNLVNQILAGDIQATNKQPGAHFVLTLPMDVTSEEQRQPQSSNRG